VRPRIVKLRGLIVQFTIIAFFLIPGPEYFQLIGSVYGQTSGLWPRPPDATNPPVFFCRVIHTYPHDPNAFTQGLVFEDGYFFEGTGLKGQSSLRKIVPETGRIVKIKSLPHRYFGEGVTMFKDRLIQLTWKSGVGFVYNKQSFRTVNTFLLTGEGWGITTDTNYLIVSDGSNRLYFLDPETFAVSNTIRIRDPNGPVIRLNELEFVEGFILANIWQTDRIAVIVPETGQVAAWIALDGLRKGPRQGVANGIAYDRKGGRLFVTGKRWPNLFEVALIPDQ